MAHAASFRDRPLTEADHVVAAARARSLGIEKLPRFLLRGTYWNAPVVGMQKLPERSLENLWRMRGKEINSSERHGFNMTIAWEGARLVVRTDRAFLDDTDGSPYTSCRYWDGREGWWGNLSEDSRTIGRYRLIDKLISSTTWMPFVYIRTLSNRLAWPGEVLGLEHEPAHPSLTRYQRVGTETLDGEQCDVFDGPARYERIWIEKSTGRIKAVYRRSLHREHPQYYTDLVREVAGRVFEDHQQYAAWVKQQPKELRAILSAYWGEVHWPLSEPSHLLLFSDYRQVGPGVEWPMRCERLQMNYAGRRAQDGFNYTRCVTVFDEATTGASLDPLVAVTLPRQGDKIWDHRFDVSVDYEWKEDLTEAEVQALVDEKRRKLLESQALIAERQRPLNEMVGKPAPPLPESGWLVDSESPIAKRLGGRPYLLHFWATWCGPCKSELPLVQSLHESGSTVIGVHPGGGGPEQAEEIQAFVREQGLQYPQLLAPKDDQNVAGYPVGMYPYSAIVDAEGRVAAHGFLKPELLRTLRRLEKKKQP